jgi:hypothetical protein
MQRWSWSWSSCPTGDGLLGAWAGRSAAVGSSSTCICPAGERGADMTWFAVVCAAHRTHDWGHLLQVPHIVHAFDSQGVACLVHSG